MSGARRGGLGAALLGACIAGGAAAVEFSAAERSVIAGLGPWPPPFVADSSNRASGDPRAVRLGEALFFDHALGGDSRLSCASCHDPGRGFADGRALGLGRKPLARNTAGLLNLAGNRWFGWGGESDSLWAQSIRPLLASDEMASSAAAVATLVRGSPRYRAGYRDAFGENPDSLADQRLLVDVAKALAAYQETLQSPRTRFDDFRDALLAGDDAAAAVYPAAARRGLKLFIGEGRCVLCHFGPKFSSGEFADIGIPFFAGAGVDPGRHRGIAVARASPFNRLGRYNDGDPRDNAPAIRGVRRLHRNFGEFKVPGLRSLIATSPYMHNGILPDLRGVVRHYSTIDETRLHADGDKILRPLRWSAAQVEDMVAFLESLAPPR